MNSEEWAARCAARLRERWQHVPEDQLREVAAEIQRETQRQLDQPEHAATVWLRRGIPDAQ